MAVDTRNKRASVLGIGLAALVVLPAPDATIGQADRQQVAYCYAGILAAPVVPPVVLDLCHAHVVNLNPIREVVSLNPLRDVVSLNPVRGIWKCCS